MTEDSPTPFDETDSSPRRWVAVSNEMIMARLDWDIMMHRILMVLISQIDSRTTRPFGCSVYRPAASATWPR